MFAKLTKFSTQGGCGCKIPPAILEELLADIVGGHAMAPDALLAGGGLDDAAVWRLDGQRALLVTTDFFTPLLDDPFDFGRVAAANALSDIYAMGGKPLFALSVLAVPLKKLGVPAVREILRGAREKCSEAGIPLAGGHSIEIAEPVFGLVVIGEVETRYLRFKTTGRAGDTLVLGKALGTGMLAAAFRKGQLSRADQDGMLEVLTRLNSIGGEIARLPGVHAMTDITGFGLLGHLMEMCRGANLGAELRMEKVPLLAAAIPFAQSGILSGAVGRNRDSIASHLRVVGDIAAWRQDFLFDPQTNGGLLVSCAPTVLEEVLALFQGNGFPEASVVGQLRQESGISVHAETG